MPFKVEYCRNTPIIFENTAKNKRLLPKHLRFADDIVILAEAPKDLGHMTNIESSKVGLEIEIEMNINKTKIMCNSHKKSISLNGTTVEYVDRYTYLGKQVSFSKTSSEEEITRRAKITWKQYWSSKEILKGDYSISVKKNVTDTCLLPCLTYGSQTWPFTEKIKDKIRSTQRAMERSMLRLRKVNKCYGCSNTRS
ncbi:Putative uncharacterized transposon-derived protein F52C9.6 [Eumeta japonica]|uniref:Uncharacterized transposon-derived protein F52C9.6 n=1 Tax=Eumeta variegata TaxID=151549 RepID=A0A4C1SE57_EUMVA|nr:Putative uncharacterized transposon-derived protein F52C9.6 [Eumeta japonica]